MPDTSKFYIGGAWVEPIGTRQIAVIDPASEIQIGTLTMGSAADVDRAVAAAKTALPGFAQETVRRRQDLLRSIHAEMERRFDDMADAMTQEMGAPASFSRESQALSGCDHVKAMIEVLDGFAFDELRGTSMITREPIGVCGMITPWNWPINQIACKVVPALAAGCTMVLKPSEIAPLSGLVFAEILHNSGVPAGVFNLVNGDGPDVGAAMSAHPDIDMMSFTGSTRAGIAVARAASGTVKRVAQELGGNSPNIVLDDADITAAVRQGVLLVMSNSGQSCNSPQRMLVPHSWMDEAAAIARDAAESLRVGLPGDPATDLGPVISQAHFDKVQRLIQLGIDEGATLATGGTGRPAGLNRGYFVRPTVFADVKPTMDIARTEIFGPVIMLIGYGSEDEAVAIANDTEYGLAACIQSGNLDRARLLSRRLRAGTVEINYPPFDYFAPFGGYRQSGNGREYGAYGLLDYLETKAIVGYGK